MLTRMDQAQEGRGSEELPQVQEPSVEQGIYKETKKRGYGMKGKNYITYKETAQADKKAEQLAEVINKQSDLKNGEAREFQVSVGYVHRKKYYRVKVEAIA